MYEIYGLMIRKEIRVRINKEGGGASSKYITLGQVIRKDITVTWSFHVANAYIVHTTHLIFFQLKSSQRQTKSIGKIFEIFGSFQITLSFN